MEGLEGVDPNAYALRKIVSGLDEPVDLKHAGDGSGRLFVVEQAGRIRIIRNGVLQPDPFLDIEPLVNSRGNEQGLLGLAFHPDYESNAFFFVNYTDVNGDTVVARYSVSADDPNRADPASAKILLQVDQPFANHNGGDLVFGPDGYLYIGLGDGGSAGDPQGNGQTLSTLLGKLLRIDINNGDPYAIPPGNPFLGRPEVRPEIWAYGLRNPWRYAFDRATGDLYIADVGQNALEEINFQPAGSPGGENYGWNLYEGSRAYEGGPAEGLIMPVAEYSHAEGCSVTGGYVYRGPGLPALDGVYLYGDYCSGQVWALYRTASGWENTALFEAFFFISSFGEDEAGELYLLDHRGGAVYQLVAAP
jgi:glucose/arabinose dehydrogenase